MIVGPKDMGRFSQCPKVYEMQSSYQVVVRWPWGLDLKAHSSPLSGHLGQVPPTSLTCILVAFYGSGRPWVCFCLWHLCPGQILHPTFCWWPSGPPCSQMFLVPCWSWFCWSSASGWSWIASPRQYTWSLYSASPLLNGWQNSFWDTSSDYMGSPRTLFSIWGPNSVLEGFLLLGWGLFQSHTGLSSSGLRGSVLWLGCVWSWVEFIGAVLLYLGLLSHLRFPSPSS